MAKYTTELGTLIKMGFEPGLNDYPIFDEAYRDVLNSKIINHFRYCEIGSETPGRFNHYLKSTMAEIMPYYNKLYRSELLDFNPLYDVDYTETSKKTTAGESDTTTNRTATGTNDNTQTLDTSTDNNQTEDLFTVGSDTPGGLISVGDIKSNTWASNANKSENIRENITTNTGTVTDDGETTLTETGGIGVTVNNVDDYIKTVQGKTGGKNYSEMLLDFRATLLNIDMQIIKDLKILFMGVY